MSHGYYLQKGRAQAYGLLGIDRRRSVGKAALEFRDELLAALGGADMVSPQKRCIIDEITLLQYLTGYADDVIVRQPSPLVGSGEEQRFPALVRDRIKIGKQKAQLVTLLGMEREARVVDFALALREREFEREREEKPQPVEVETS